MTRKIVVLLLIVTSFSFLSCVTGVNENEVRLEDIDEIISEAIELSKHGNEAEVIKMLKPICNRKYVCKEYLFKTHMTLALQYYRFRDFNNFKHHVIEAEKVSDLKAFEYWIKQLEIYKGVVERGAF